MSIRLVAGRKLEEVGNAVLASHHGSLPTSNNAKADAVQHTAVLQHVPDFEMRFHIWQI
jgi:hypothetical protein